MILIRFFFVNSDSLKLHKKKHNLNGIYLKSLSGLVQTSLNETDKKKTLIDTPATAIFECRTTAADEFTTAYERLLSEWFRLITHRLKVMTAWTENSIQRLHPKNKLTLWRFQMWLKLKIQFHFI